MEYLTEIYRRRLPQLDDLPELHLNSPLQQFVNYQVNSHCSSDNSPPSVIVMDDAKIHWAYELEEMCKEAGVTVGYLPPCSPDHNPIETSFAILEMWIKNTRILRRCVLQLVSSAVSYS